MKVEFRTTVDDYLTFYKYFFFRRRIGWRILLVMLLCLAVANGWRESHADFSWTTLLITLLVGVVIIVLGSAIPYIRTVRKTRKMFPVSGLPTPRKIILSADGFTVTRESEDGASTVDGFWRWESVRSVGSTGRFVFIQLLNWRVIVIPRPCFQTDSEVDNFIGIVRNMKARVRGSGQESNQAKARRAAYWGLLGIIPNVGAVAGVVLLILGIIYKSTKLIIIAVADILFTVVFWAVVVSWVFNGPAFTKLNRELSKKQLNTIFKSVEFYKLQHGHYPDSLKEVEDIQGFVWIEDPLFNRGLRPKPVNFYYEKTGNKYWLFSVGDDGRPFTADDIYPAMNPADSTKFGMRLP